MTVTAQTPSNSSTGNGATTVFPYTFKIISQADIEVSVDGVVQALNTHYTVSGAGDNAGGNVTFLSAPASGAIVVRRRNMQEDARTRASASHSLAEMHWASVQGENHVPVLGEGL